MNAWIWMDLCLVVPNSTPLRFVHSQALDHYKQNLVVCYSYVFVCTRMFLVFLVCCLKTLVWCFSVMIVWSPCCNMLDGVGSSLKMVKFFVQHFLTFHDVVLVWPSLCNIVAAGHAHKVELLFQSATQHVAKYCNMVAKRVQHVCETNLRNVVLGKCCVRLASPSRNLATRSNNVARYHAFVWPGINIK